MTRQKTVKEATMPRLKSSEKSTKPKGGARPGAGRPKESYKLQSDDKTLDTLESLGKIQATTKEAAAFFKVSEKTFIEFLQRDKKAEEVFENGKESGKTSLRRAQFQAALKGNPTMLVWLGKQLLGQRDKSDVEHSGKLTLAELVLGSYKTEAHA